MTEEFIETEDVIEDNLLKSLSPPHFMLTILGASRVRIKNKMALNTTILQVVYSIFWLVLVSLSSSLFQMFYFNAYFYKNLLMYVICFFGITMQVISYYLIMFVNRFTQKSNNVKIYSMLQKVDRILQLDKCSYYTDFHYRLNITVIIAITVGFFIGFGLNGYSLLGNTAIYTVFYGLGLLSMYMDNVVGAGLIYFLAVRAQHLNRIIKNRIQEYRDDVQKKPKKRTLKKNVLALVRPEVQKNLLDISHEKWLECLLDMMKSYKTITELYSFSIFNIALTVLIWTFVVIAAMVVGLRTGLFPVFACATVGAWACFYYILLTTSAAINDWFIMEIKKMKLLCIRLISYDYDGPFQKTASDMINAIHGDTPIFVVYGIFVFDRALPLEIMGVIASNALVLVQFII